MRQRSLHFLAGKKPELVLVAVYPIAAFWFLDAHSLAMERAFRRLYDKACAGSLEPYTMSLKGIRRPFVDQMDAMLSGTLLIFYGSALVFVLLIARSV